MLMKKVIVTIGIIGIIGIFSVGIIMIVSVKKQEKSYYRSINGTNNGMHYELVTERTEKCVYIGDDTYVTEDGNMWVYDGKERKIDHRYMITISDNATTTEIKDDIVMFVK